MKKQRALVIVLVVLVAVLAGTYLALRSWNQQEQNQEEPAVTVAALSDITALTITNQYGTFSFTKGEEGWSYDADSAFPVEGSYLDTVTGVLAGLTAQRAFDTPDALSGYGLDVPACSVQAKTADGETLTVLVGDATGSSYYAKTDSGDTVYTISGDLYTALDYSLNDLVALADIPAAGEADLISLQLTRGSQTLTLTKETETVEGEAAPESSADPAQSSQPEVTYRWLLDGAEIEKGEALSTALGELAYLSFDACYAYDPGETVLAQCGLDSPVLRLVVTTQDQAYALSIGGTDESGACYARLNDSGPVYLLSSDSAQALTALTYDTLTTQTAA